MIRVNSGRVVDVAFVMVGFKSVYNNLDVQKKDRLNKLISDIQKINLLGIEIQDLNDSISIVSSPELQQLYTEKMDEVLSDYNRLCLIVKDELELHMREEAKDSNVVDLSFYRLLKELRNEQ